MTRLLTLIALFAASPAFAAGGPFLSLRNTDFVVLIAFVIFVAAMLYFKVPSMLGGMLDKRAETIRAELNEARQLREEAQELRAAFERKRAEVKDQADRIVATAKADAEAAAKQAKVDLEVSIARRLKAAEDQIAAAEAAAVREVRNQAVAVSIAAARDLIAKKLDPADAAAMIDDSIKTVDARLH